MASSDISVDKDMPSSHRPLHQQISKTSTRKSVSWVGLLPSLFIIVVTAGVASLIIVWLTIHRFRFEDLNIRRNFGTPMHEGVFVLDEGFHDPQGKKGVNGLVAAMRILTFSSFAGHVVPIASSILMILVAYRTAARWLHASETREDVEHACPTALQYGLLIRLLGGSGVMALIKTLRYTHRKDRARLPPIFLEATTIAIIIFVLAQLISITDLWLHSTATSIIVETSIPMSNYSDSLYRWSVQLNGSDPRAFGLCSPWIGSPWPCLNTPEGWADDADKDETQLEIAYTGWETAYNLTDSSLFTTVQLPNTTSSFLMPRDAWGSIDTIFTASTYGASASCKIITNECTANKTSGLTTTCVPAGYPQLPIVGDYPTAANTHPAYQSLSNSTVYSASNPTFTLPSRILGLVDGHLAGLGSGMADLPPASSLTNNPTTTLLQLHWSSFYGNTPLPVINIDGYQPASPTRDPFKGREKARSGDKARASTVIRNEGMLESGTGALEYFKANVTYDPSLLGYWTLESKELLNSNLTSILWSPLMAQYATESLAAEIMGIASSNTPAYTTHMLNELLGRLAIAFPSGLFDPAPVTALHQVDYRILGLYPIGPVALLVSVLYFYSIIAVFVFVTTQTAASYGVIIPEATTPAEDEKSTPELRSEKAAESNALELGHTWLIDPIPFVSSMFSEGDGHDGKRSATLDALETHKDTGAGSKRLEIGVFERDGETVFGVKSRGEQGIIV